jgi:hypothetical protein
MVAIAAGRVLDLRQWHGNGPGSVRSNPMAQATVSTHGDDRHRTRAPNTRRVDLGHPRRGGARPIVRRVAP